MTIKRYIGIGKETVFGDNPPASRWLESVENIVTDQNIIIPTSVGQRERRKYAFGPFRGRGNIGPFEIEPENAGELILGGMGSVTTTVPYTNVYLHTFKPADLPPSFSLRLGVELTQRRLCGCLVNALTFDFKHDLMVKLTAEMLGSFVLETSSAIESASFSPLQPFVSPASILTIEGVDKRALVSAGEITLKNNIPYDRGDLSSRFFTKKRVGIREINGKLDIYFDDLTERQRFLDGTPFGLIVEFTGALIVTGYYYRLKFYLPSCIYSKDAAPHLVPQNEPLVLNAPFESLLAPAGTEEIKIELQNQISSY